MPNETLPAEVIHAEPAAMKDALDIIEQRNALYDRVMAVAIKATSPGDWIDQNGKPYLQGSGAEKVARRFGVRIFDVEIDREELEDSKGRYYLYSVTGKAQLGTGNDVIEAIGTCSSRDPFFSKGGKVESPDVDVGNIKKSAYTNFVGNAITRLLGIRNMSWEELAKHGIGRNGKTSISYDKGASKAAATKSAANAEAAAKKPYWTNDWNGKTYVNAREGKHFSADFLKNLGLKPSQKTAGCWGGLATDQVMAALEEEYQAGEEALKYEKEAANGTAG